MKHITRIHSSSIAGTKSGAGKAFTLIELLIVVAIIAILAAIAVPNFLEAQVRSKVSRVKADMRSLRVALECYRVDNNNYLPDRGGSAGDYTTWAALTTPVAYITTVVRDPFTPELGMRNPYAPNFFEYGASIRPGGSGLTQGWPENMRAAGLEYWILSPGPDQDYDLFEKATSGMWGDGQNWVDLDAGTRFQEVLYDGTNGTRSSGDIIASNKRMYN